MVKIYPEGETNVSTLAGSGSKGDQDGESTTAQFNKPNGVAVDAEGNVIVCDSSNHRIRKIAPDGQVSTLAGCGSRGYQDDHLDGYMAQFCKPHGICVAPSGDVYVSDTYNHRIRKITPDGKVFTLTGSKGRGYQDGGKLLAQFNYPMGICADAAGNLYVADTYNHRIRKITPRGWVSTLAGTGTEGFRDSDKAECARFNTPYGVAVDADGNVHVADSANHRIRTITPWGRVFTLAGDGEIGHNDVEEEKAAKWARFDNPLGLTVDAGGNVIVADGGNHCLRVITNTGMVFTLAGNRFEGHEDGPGRGAQFYDPYGVVVTKAGSIVVADTSNHRVRAVDIALPAHCDQGVGDRAGGTTVGGSWAGGGVETQPVGVQPNVVILVMAALVMYGRFVAIVCDVSAWAQ